MINGHQCPNGNKWRNYPAVACSLCMQGDVQWKISSRAPSSSPLETPSQCCQCKKTGVETPDCDCSCHFAESSPKPAESERVDLKQVANMLYDLFRSAPIPAKINGDGGRAAFYDRDAQRAQALIILTKIWQAARATPLPEPPRQTPCTLCMGSEILRQEIREQLAASSHSGPELEKLADLAERVAARISDEMETHSEDSYFVPIERLRQVVSAALASIPQNEGKS